MFAKSAQAWLILFFPVAGGLNGNMCVPESAKVGETLHSPTGNVAMIKYIEGKDLLCRADDKKPVLATVEYTMSSFSSKAGISLPDGYVSRPLSPRERFDGVVLEAWNEYRGAGTSITAASRDVIAEIEVYVDNARSSEATLLDDAVQTETERLNINGLNGWRFQTKGRVKSFMGAHVTRVVTILEGQNEVLAVKVWTRTSNFAEQKQELLDMARQVMGIAPPKGTAAADRASGGSQPAATQTPEARTPILQPATASGTASARLRELHKLYNEGVITEKEFENKKAEILKSM